MELPFPEDVTEWSWETVERLSAFEENLYLEYKSRLSPDGECDCDCGTDHEIEDWSRTVEREMVAFANAHGGFIAFGIDDDGEPRTCERPDHEPKQSVARFYQHTVPTLDVEVSEAIEHPDNEERICLVARVFEADRKPVLTRESGVYRRITDRKEPMSREQMESLFVQHKRRQQSIRRLEFEVNRFCGVVSGLSYGFGRDKHRPPFEKLNLDVLKGALRDNVHLYTDEELREAIDDVLDCVLELEETRRNIEQQIEDLNRDPTGPGSSVYDSKSDVYQTLGRNIKEDLNRTVSRVMNLAEKADLEIDYDRKDELEL